MNRFVRSLLLCLALTVGATAWAQQQPAQPEQPAQAAEPAQPAAPETPAVEEPVERDSDIRINLRDRSDNVILNMWGDARLPANDIADGVIAIFGDTHVEGEVWDAVVAIFGNSHVTGPVHGGVVSVFGNTYIDGPVQEAAVAVFGDLELGPNARVEGDIAVVAGKLTRHPDAVVSGQSEIVAGGFPAVEGVRVWIEKCLLYARPLAFESGLGWAWGIAFGFLLFYVVIALMFDRGVTRCVETLETQPGQSVVASLMAVVLVPVAFLLLVISVVGIVIVPFAGMAMVVASLFGKAVALAAIGRRVTRFTGVAPFSHIAFATLVGGLIAMALYVIPVIGFIAYKLLGVIGLGVVAYTILLTIRERSANRAQVVAAAAPVAAAAARWRKFQRRTCRSGACAIRRARSSIGASACTGRDHSTARRILDPHGRADDRHRADQRHRRHPRLVRRDLHRRPRRLRRADVEAQEHDDRRPGVRPESRAPRRRGDQLGHGDRARARVFPVDGRGWPGVPVDRVR